MPFRHQHPKRLAVKPIARAVATACAVAGRIAQAGAAPMTAPTPSLCRGQTDPLPVGATVVRAHIVRHHRLHRKQEGSPLPRA